jgi:transposase-like protein
VEELLAERGIEVDHVTIYRWVQRSCSWHDGWMLVRHLAQSDAVDSRRTGRSTARWLLER